MTLPWKHPSPRMIVDTQISAVGLPAYYWAHVDLNNATFTQYADGVRPIMAATEMAKLLADVNAIGNLDEQLAQLGWTVSLATDAAAGTVMFHYHPSHHIDDETVQPENGLWYTLPAAPRWTTPWLPPVASIHRTLLRLNTIEDGADHEPVDDEDLTVEGTTALRALGELYADILLRTVLATRNGAEALSELNAAFVEGLTDGRLPGRGSVLPTDDLAARMLGCRLTAGERHAVITMAESDFHALITELDLLPGDLGRWKGSATAKLDIKISPKTFVRDGMHTYERVLAFIRHRGLPYAEHRETVYLPAKSRARHLQHTQHHATTQTPPAVAEPPKHQSPSLAQEPSATKLSLERICALLNQRGIPAKVDGTVSISAIYIGNSWQDGDGETHYQLIAGPGSNERAWSDAWGDIGEFGVSRDDHGATPDMWTSAVGDTEQDCVDTIVSLFATLAQSPARLQP